MADNAAVFLGHARHETGNVDEGDQWDVECIAEADELAALVGRVDIQYTGHHVGLVGDDADRAADHSGETGHNIWCEASLDFEEVPAVDDARDDFADIVALLAVDRNNVTQCWVGLDDFFRIDDRRFFSVVLRQEAQQLLCNEHGLLIVIGDEVDVAGLRHVGVCSTQLLCGDVLTGH